VLSGPLCVSSRGAWPHFISFAGTFLVDIQYPKNASSSLPIFSSRALSAAVCFPGDPFALQALSFAISLFSSSPPLTFRCVAVFLVTWFCGLQPVQRSSLCRIPTSSLPLATHCTSVFHLGLCPDCCCQPPFVLLCLFCFLWDELPSVYLCPTPLGCLSSCSGMSLL